MKSRPGSAGVSRRKSSTRSETQLVLLFIFLLVMCYTVIVRKHIYMPVDPDITEQEEKKHGRSERAQLQAEFTRQGMNTIGKELHDAFISVEEAAVKALHHGHVDHKQGSGVGHVPEEVWRERQTQVVQAAKESWAAYELHAFGFDELEPVKQKGKNNFGALGAMIADCLDTLWLFGLREEFDRARDWVVNSMNLNSMAKLSLFETNIRILGGLLAAFDLSQDTRLLNKARDLADRLLPNFDLATTGIPRNLVLLKPQLRGVPKQPMGASRAALAEYGTFTLEFLGLSHRTRNPEYGAKAEAIIQGLHERNPERGLMPVWINRSSGKFQGRELLTVGAMADSYYEYLLKTWLYTRKQQEIYRAMWEKATDEALAKLVRVGKDGYQYLGILNGANIHVVEQDNFSSQMEHLACYFPGNVALGVHTGAVKGAKAALYLEAAKNLTATCWHMYAKQPTGLAPEVEYFANSKGGAGSAKAGAGIRAANLLRPEAVESLWYMWRVTHEQQWRDYGWTMFQSFQKHCRQPDGSYSGIHDVRELNSSFTNGMETFWVAETLKYFWLLFGPDDVLHWDSMILNTEAHPLFLSNASVRSVSDIAAAVS